MGSLSLGPEDNFHAILNICFTSFLKREIMFSLGGGKKEEKLEWKSSDSVEG